jgi:hypothetical protein
MLSRVAVLSLGVLTLVSCVPATVEPPPRLGCAPPPKNEDDNIREAVLRDLVNAVLSSRAHSRGSGTVRVVFVGIDGGPDPTSPEFGWDPSDSFLSRFSDVDPPVKPVSAALIGSRARDRETGELGTIFGAGAVCWVGLHEVEVDAFTWSGTTAGASVTYHLYQGSRGWVVWSRNTNWVS